MHVISRATIRGLILTAASLSLVVAAAIQEAAGGG